MTKHSLHQNAQSPTVNLLVLQRVALGKISPSRTDGRRLPQGTVLYCRMARQVRSGSPVVLSVVVVVVSCEAKQPHRARRQKRLRAGRGAPPTVLVTYCIQNCSMAPKKAVKKLKSAVTAAAATSKKSPDKLRAKVAAAALQEEEEEDVEVNVDDLLKFFKKETPAPAPAPAEASAPAAAAPAPAMADAAPPVSAVTSTETPAIATAAGSAAAAVNAKRSETAATPAADDAKAALEQAGKDALAEALGMVRKAAPPPLDDKALLEALKTARKAVADANKLMTNMVCDTSLLEAIAKSKPKTLKELELVEEFGPTRAERCEQP